VTPAKSTPRDPVTREILLSFWKIHILHHAEERPIYGQWIADELRRHGYKISPGTLYPLLRRMEANGWLASNPPEGASKAHSRKEYRLTKSGAKILAFLRVQVKELHHEVIEERLLGEGQH
jgi:DNA-binding PadR family transcriptional regulator